MGDSTSNAVQTTLKQVIEEVTGNVANDIHDDADLVEDLGISRIELSKILSTSSNKLEIVLSDYARQELMRSETVGDLIDILQEEYEF